MIALVLAVVLESTNTCVFVTPPDNVQSNKVESRYIASGEPDFDRRLSTNSYAAIASLVDGAYERALIARDDLKTSCKTNSSDKHTYSLYEFDPEQWRNLYILPSELVADHKWDSGDSLRTFKPTSRLELGLMIDNVSDWIKNRLPGFTSRQLIDLLGGLGQTDPGKFATLPGGWVMDTPVDIPASEWMNVFPYFDTMEGDGIIKPFIGPTDPRPRGFDRSIIKSYISGFDTSQHTTESYQRAMDALFKQIEAMPLTYGAYRPTVRDILARRMNLSDEGLWYETNLWTCMSLFTNRAARVDARKVAVSDVLLEQMSMRYEHVDAERLKARDITYRARGSYDVEVNSEDIVIVSPVDFEVPVSRIVGVCPMDYKRMPDPDYQPQVTNELVNDCIYPFFRTDGVHTTVTAVLRLTGDMLDDLRQLNGILTGTLQSLGYDRCQRIIFEIKMLPHANSLSTEIVLLMIYPEKQFPDEEATSSMSHKELSEHFDRHVGFPLQIGLFAHAGTFRVKDANLTVNVDKTCRVIRTFSPEETMDFKSVYGNAGKFDRLGDLYAYELDVMVSADIAKGVPGPWVNWESDKLHPKYDDPPGGDPNCLRQFRQNPIFLPYYRVATGTNSINAKFSDAIRDLNASMCSAAFFSAGLDKKDVVKIDDDELSRFLVLIPDEFTNVSCKSSSATGYTYWLSGTYDDEGEFAGDKMFVTKDDAWFPKTIDDACFVPIDKVSIGSFEMSSETSFDVSKPKPHSRIARSSTVVKKTYKYNNIYEPERENNEQSKH